LCLVNCNGKGDINGKSMSYQHLGWPVGTSTTYDGAFPAILGFRRQLANRNDNAVRYQCQIFPSLDGERILFLFLFLFLQCLFFVNENNVDVIRWCLE
jgi:hypothetical protein